MKPKLSSIIAFFVILSSCSIHSIIPSKNKSSPGSPFALESFSAITGTAVAGDIILNINFPNQTDQFGKVTIRRQKGNDAPNNDCQSNGTQILSITKFNNASFIDATDAPGETFSYIACVFDSNNQNAFQTAVTGVKSKSTGNVTRIFVSSASYNGNLGGLAGADKNCQTLAANANLGTNWLALLSTSDKNAKDRIDFDNDLENMRGETIADSSSKLWSENIDAAVRYDENGNDAGTLNVWTGTTWQGTPGAAAGSCQNWTSASGFGMAGLSDQTSSSWIGAGNNDCSSQENLYCISYVNSSSQGQPASNSGARIFLSSKTYNGNLGGRPGADAKCQTLAEAENLTGTWMAVLSDGLINAKDRVVFSGNLYDMAGEVVADSATDLWDQPIEAAIRFDETGTAATSGSVWSGSCSNGENCSGIANCQAWSSSSSSVSGGSGDAAYTDSWWLGEGNESCDQSYRIYCFSGD